jgi:hypothetical protein
MQSKWSATPECADGSGGWQQHYQRTEVQSEWLYRCELNGIVTCRNQSAERPSNAPSQAVLVARVMSSSPRREECGAFEQACDGVAYYEVSASVQQLHETKIGVAESLEARANRAFFTGIFETGIGTGRNHRSCRHSLRQSKLIDERDSGN